MDKVLAPRELSWKTHGCKKGKMNSTAMGKTLSPGRELLKRVPFNERTWGVLSDRAPGSQSRPVFFVVVVLFYFSTMLSLNLGDPSRQGVAHREASQKEAGETAATKSLPGRVQGLGTVGQGQCGRQWPAWGRWGWEISTPHRGLEPDCLGSNSSSTSYWLALGR